MKKIYCIGDSLTEGDYGIPGKSGIANVHEKNYPYFLKQLTQCDVINKGYCGYRASHILDLFNQGTIDVTGSDIIIILLGTNGGNTASGNSVDDIAYKKIVELCRKQAPQAHLFICTPPHVTSNPSKSNCGYYPNIKGAYDFLIPFVKKENLELIDLFNDKTFSEETEDIMQPNDGLHFGEVGYQALANIIYNHIKKYL